MNPNALCLIKFNTLGWPIYLAGLIDGLNPCVFSIYLFLYSCLFFLKKQRQTIVLFGILFISSVFITNYLVGLGILSLLHSANNLIKAKWLIKSPTIIALLFFSTLLALDLLNIGKFKTGLPIKTIQNIHNKIRDKLKNKFIFSAAISIGAITTLAELPCSGQIYLPSITYLILKKNTLSAGLIKLSVYNLFFIIPLIAIFVLSFIITDLFFVTHFFQSNIRAFKFLGLLIISLLLYCTLII